jgi:hypothetical protein
MKFNESLTYQHLSEFNVVNARNFLDLFVLQKIISMSSAKNILEVGYYEGLTFGVLYEASDADAKLTSCDVTYEYDIFRKLIKIEKDCRFIQCKSVDLKLNDKFDFIVIDGDHTYNTVKEELPMLHNWASDNCIIMIDDFAWEGPDQALTEFLPDSGFILCLIGPQQVFLIRSQNKDVYQLIDKIKEQVIPISSWSTINYKGSVIYQYQYTHEIFINTLKDIIKILDL